MANLFKKNLKVFIRTRHIFIVSLLAACCVLLYLAYRGYAFAINWDVLYFLKGTQDCCLFVFIVGLYLSYEFFFKVKNNGIEECIASHKNGRQKLYSSMFTVLTLLVFQIYIVAVVLNFAIALIGGTNDIGYYLHIALVNLLNIFLLGTLANLLGMCLAIKFKRIAAYSLMALIVFIVSPVSDMIPGVSTDSYGYNLWPAKWLFSKVLPPNQDWVTDAQYGLSNEMLRWNLMFFWIFLFIAIAFFSIMKRKTIKRVAITLLAVVLASVNLYGYFLGGSEIILGSYPDSISRRDKEYYREHLEKEKAASFTVAAYDMNISIFRELEAKVMMEIGEPSKANKYEFTLYHGYKILSVAAQDGTMLNYIRDGDYITISSDNPLSRITVHYKGFSPCLFSNNQAVLLPGCFPYYPMAGFYRLNNGGQGYIPVINKIESQYRVQISHLKQLYCNLPENTGKKNVFSGKASALSIIGGFVEGYHTGNYNVCALSVPGYGIPTVDDIYLSKLQKEIDHAERTQGKKQHLTLKGKTIFQVDTMFANFAQYDVAVLFDDHIFLMAGYDGYLPEYAEMLVKEYNDAEN